SGRTRPSRRQLSKNVSSTERFRLNRECSIQSRTQETSMRRSSLFLTTLGSALLGACASNSGVVPIGPDTFMISRQAATGFTGSGNLKADALREAKQYCASLKKV